MFDFATIDRNAMPRPGPIAVSAPDRDALLADLETRLVAGQGFSLATLNLDHLVKIGSDPAFRSAYAAQTHVTADGNPVVWLCRLAGQDVSLIPGSELVEPVAAMAARLGLPVAMVGSTEASLEGGRGTDGAIPGLNVPARIAPPMGFDPEGPGADSRHRSPAPRARGSVSWLWAPQSRKSSPPAHKRRCRRWASCRSAPVSTSCRATRHGHRDGCSAGAGVALADGWKPGRLVRRYAECFAILPAAIRAARRARNSRQA
jgi:N-acetylglucosaminyldiphosphoundecaprenol N-acetyl-beta-D-mannosaminyltransferase